MVSAPVAHPPPPSLVDALKQTDFLGTEAEAFESDLYLVYSAIRKLSPCPLKLYGPILDTDRDAIPY